MEKSGREAERATLKTDAGCGLTPDVHPTREYGRAYHLHASLLWPSCKHGSFRQVAPSLHLSDPTTSTTSLWAPPPTVCQSGPWDNCFVVLFIFHTSSDKTSCLHLYLLIYHPRVLLCVDVLNTQCSAACRSGMRQDTSMTAAILSSN